MPTPNELHKFTTITSKIIWSSGSHDPWSSQSVNRSLSPTLLAVMIEGGAHHLDLRYSDLRNRRLPCLNFGLLKFAKSTGR